MLKVRSRSIWFIICRNFLSDLFSLQNYVFKDAGINMFSRMQEVVKSELTHSLMDSNDDIRRTASIIISKICDSFMFDVWQDMFLYVIQTLEPSSGVNTP